MNRTDRSNLRLAAAREVFFTAQDSRRREIAFAIITRIVERRLTKARRSGEANRCWMAFQAREGLRLMPPVSTLH